MSNDTNVLQEASDALKAKAGKEVNDIVEDIISSATPTRKTVDKGIYDKMYKGFFNGSDVKENDPRGDMWLEISGGVHNPVDIVDSSGKVHDTVPAISGKITVDQNAVKAVGGANVGTKYSAIQASNPLDASVYQANVANTISNATKVANNSDEWKDFMARNKDEDGLIDAIKKDNSSTTNSEKLDTSKLVIE